MLYDGRLPSMNVTMKTIVKHFLPPVLWHGAKYFHNLLQAWVRQKSSGKGPCEQKSEWYDESFVLHDSWHGHYTESDNYLFWLVIADRISRAGIRSVLDVGCGPGQMACLLRDKGVEQYCGIDFSPKRIQFARQVCPGFSFIVEDVFLTEVFETFHYDAVVCTEFLEHVERDVEVIESIRSGAKFYGTVPNFPYVSHVRHFRNSREVYDRYSKFFKNFRVSSILVNEKGKTHYLLEGIKS